MAERTMLSVLRILFIGISFVFSFAKIAIIIDSFANERIFNSLIS